MLAFRCCPYRGGSVPPADASSSLRVCRCRGCGLGGEGRSKAGQNAGMGGGGRKEVLAGCTCWPLGLPEPARLTRSVWVSVLEGRLLGRTEGWLRWGERKQPFAFWGPGGHPARPSLAKFPSPHGAVWATTLSPHFKKLCETRLAHPALCPGPSSPHLGSPTGTPMTAGR